MNTKAVAKSIKKVFDQPQPPKKQELLDTIWQMCTKLLIMPDGTVMYRGEKLTINEKQYVCDQKYINEAMRALGCSEDDILRIGPRIRKIHTIAEQMCIVDNFHHRNFKR